MQRCLHPENNRSNQIYCHRRSSLVGMRREPVESVWWIVECLEVEQQGQALTRSHDQRDLDITASVMSWFSRMKPLHMLKCVRCRVVEMHNATLKQVSNHWEAIIHWFSVDTPLISRAVVHFYSLYFALCCCRNTMCVTGFSMPIYMSKMSVVRPCSRRYIILNIAGHLFSTLCHPNTSIYHREVAYE